MDPSQFTSSAASMTRSLGLFVDCMLRRHLESQSSNNKNNNFSFNASLTPNSNNATFPPLDNGVRNNDAGGGRDAYEFVAFLLWYLFLVLCCVIPTCCAYRRRRLVEARLAQQQASVSRIERQNIFILSSLRQHNQQNSEQIRLERAEKITEKLKETTMLVREEDIVDISAEEQEDLACAQCSVKIVEQADNENTNAGDLAVEYDVEAADPESTHALQLKTTEGGDNTPRRVPAACAICLCPYEQEDEVTWSPKEECLHAFHKECIIPWLAKTEEPKCPCCRQDFCDAVSTSQVLDVEGNGLVSAGSNARNEIFLPHHFMRTLEGTPFHINSPFEFPQLQQINSNSGRYARRDVGQPRRIEQLFLNGSPFIVHSVDSVNVNDHVEGSNSNTGDGEAPTNNENSNSSSHNEERYDSEEHEEQHGLELTPTSETNTEGADAENADAATEEEEAQQPFSSPPV